GAEVGAGWRGGEGGRAEGGRGVAERAVERTPAAPVLAPGHRVVGAHRAALDALEPAAPGLDLERPEVVDVLHDGREHVALAAYVAGEVVPGVGARPVLRQVLGGVVDPVA